MKRTLALPALALSLAACTANPDPLDPLPTIPTAPPATPPQTPPMNPAGPTFHRDVEPILQARCQTCHRPDGIAPFSLVTYEEARARASMMMIETEARRMPPWGALETDECKPRLPFRDDMHLPAAEIEMFAEWFGAGAPEGDPKDAPPPAVFSPSDGALSRVDGSFQPQNEWTVSGQNDQFRCFVIDPQWTEQQWVTGLHFMPGNPRIVHHAIAYLDPNRASLGLAGPDGSYECFAGPRFNDTAVLLAWAPGVPAAEFDPGIALQVEPRSLIVLQVHYHPLGNTGERDLSTLQIKLGDIRPTHLMQILLIGNFEGPIGGGDGLMAGDNDPNGTPAFVIPAGATDHVETLRFTLPEMLDQRTRIPDLALLSVGAHMHYVGVDMKIEIEHAEPRPGEPQRECMLQTPQWNFQWQRGYGYDVPIEDAPQWRPNDRLHMRCIYDNSLANRFVARALQEQGLSEPRDVYLGEETLDEMCLAALTIAYPNPF